MNFISLGLLCALAANLSATLLLLGQPPRANLKVLAACVPIAVLVMLYQQVDTIGLLRIVPHGVWFYPALLLLGGKSSMAQKAFVMFTVLTVSHLLHIGSSFLATPLHATVRRPLTCCGLCWWYVFTRPMW